MAAANEDRDLIRTRYLALLARDGSPLLDDEAVMGQVVGQLYSVVDAAYQALGIELAKVEAGPRLALSVDIGRSRAVSGVHPSQSLRAAGLIFEAALPVLAKSSASAGVPNPEIAASLALNRAIMARMALAAGSYVGFLLDKIHSTTWDERRRWSRDLHDVIAPAVAVGIQELDLSLMYASTDADRARAKVLAARETMNQALSTVRSVAAESREIVGTRGLQSAVRAVLDRCQPPISTELHVSGELGLLPPVYEEELFLVVREAIRNAVAHSRPGRIEVSLVADRHDFSANVTDDGAGFEPHIALASRRTLGLTSMRERAELLGGTLRVASQPRRGTTVIVRVPHPPAFAHAAAS